MELVHVNMVILRIQAHFNVRLAIFLVKAAKMAQAILVFNVQKMFLIY
jgi:hypothetical protein